MKGSLATSAALHAIVLGFGLISLSSPKPFDVADVEALPVDIVPVESITQIQQGDKKSTVNDKPAPLPTKRPDVVPDAAKVGENDVDLDSAPTPEPKPREVKTASVPEPSPKPDPKPIEEKPQEVAKADPAPVPATELAPKPAPREEVKPDPVAEAIEAQPESAAEALALPDSAPAPAAKPQQPPAQTAKAPERKEAEKPAKQAAAKPKSDEKAFDADEVAALLNKDKPSGGGAKRSTREASLGGNKTTAGEKLTQGEMDALRAQLASCWALPGAGGGADLTGLRASVRFRVDASGKIDGSPVVESSSGNRTFDESALRAIRKCDSRGLALPKDKAEIWAEIVVNFDPSEMLF